MSVLSKKLLYAITDEAGQLELDYLNSNINDMELETDTEIRINAAFEGRPDLLSFQFYRNYDLGWLIAHHNDFLDPVEDFSIGRMIKIPTLDSYYRFVNRNRKQKPRR